MLGLSNPTGSQLMFQLLEAQEDSLHVMQKKLQVITSNICTLTSGPACLKSLKGIMDHFKVTHVTQ